MEEKEELLNEKKYKKAKSKIIIVAIIVFLIGVSIGGYLIGTGMKKSKELKEQQINSEAKERTQDDIQEEIDELNSNLATLKAKENQEFKSNGFSEEYYKLQNEINKMQSKVSNLETEIWKINSGYGSVRNSMNLQKYLPYYIFGGFVIFLTLMISGSIYMIAKRREILAFTAQQVMPVAQEGIEKMAPTVGKAGAEIMKDVAPTIGEVAKEVAKGIKEGMKEDDK